MAEPARPAPAPAQPQRGWGAGRVLVLIAGVVVALIALALLAAGAVTLWADRTQRDDDGYLTTPSEPFATARYAIASEGLDVETGDADWLIEPDRFGRIKIEASSTAGRPLFVGVGPERAVTAYLSGVAYDEVEDVDFDPFRVDYVPRPGGAPRAEPASRGFWAARALGSPEETLTWDVESGDWSVVLMNADASRGVEAEVAVGARLGFLLWVAIGLLIAGALLAVASAFLLYLAFRSPRAATA